METIFTYLSEHFPMIAIVVLTAAITTSVVWLLAVIYHRFVGLEKSFAALDNRLNVSFSAVDKQIADVKKDVDNKITALKENDFFHTNKALLLMATEIMKNNPERFERIKDTVLETTPECRRDEIKAITL
jgi:hypothetical protein